jgi:hypothetical protein
MNSRDILLKDGCDLLEKILSRQTEWYETYPEESYNWIENPQYSLLRKFFADEIREASVLQHRAINLLPQLTISEKVKVNKLNVGLDFVIQDINDKCPDTVFVQAKMELEKLKRKTLLPNGTIIDE